MPIVTIRPVDLGGAAATAEVAIEIVSADQSSGAFHSASGEILAPITRVTVTGPTQVTLAATADITPDSIYQVSAPGVKTKWFRVPAGNANLGDLISQYESAPIVRTSDAISSSESGGTVRLEFRALDGTTKVVTWQAAGAPPTGSVDYAQLASGVADDLRGAFQSVSVDDAELTFYDSAGMEHRANLLDGIREVIQAAVVNGVHTNIQVSWNSVTNGIDIVATGGSGGGGLNTATVNALIAAATENWAETAHPTERLPVGKLPAGVAMDSDLPGNASGASQYYGTGPSASAPFAPGYHDLPEGGATYDDAALSARVGNLETLGDELREYDAPFADDRLVTVSQANTAYAFPNPAVQIPTGDPGRNIQVAVNASRGGGIVNPFTFRLQDLLDKDASSAGQDLTDASSVKWDTGGVTYRAGRTGTGDLLVSSGTPAAYYWTFSAAAVNVTDHVDVASATEAGKITENRVTALANAASPTLTAANVSVDTANLGGNIPQTADTAQKAIDAIDNLTISTGGAGTPGLPAGSDAEVGQIVELGAYSAGTATYRLVPKSTDDQTAAEVNTATAQFNRLLGTGDSNVQAALKTINDTAAIDSDELDEILAGILPDAWSIDEEITVASVFSSVRRPANPENLNFGQRNTDNFYRNEVWQVIKVPDSAVPVSELANRRLFIGDSDGTGNISDPILLNDTSDNNVTFLETVAGFRYYSVKIADKPADQQVFIEFKHLLDAKATAWSPFARSLLINAPLPAIHQVLNTRFVRFTPTQTTTSSSSNQQTAAIGVTLSGGVRFRVTDSDKLHGFYHGSARITISTSGTDPNFGFEQGKANQTDDDRVAIVPIEIPASDVRTATGVADLGNATAVRAYRRPFYSLNTLLGYVQLWIGRDGLNDLEAIGRFETNGGNVNNYTISQQVDMGFLPSDEGAVTTDADIDARVNALVSAFALAATTNDSARQALATLVNAANNNNQRFGTNAVTFAARLLNIVSASDNGKILKVTAGRWQLADDVGLAASAIRNIAKTATSDANVRADLVSMFADATADTQRFGVNAISFDERILPTPTLAAAGQVAKVNSTGTGYELAADDTGSGGGGSVNVFTIGASPDADIDIVTPTPSVAGGWSAWTTIVSLAAITASQNGSHVTVVGELDGIVQEAGVDGADRIFLDYRLMRARGSTNTVMSHREAYVRTIRPNPGNTSQAFATASLEATIGSTVIDTCQTGDVYSVQARITHQAVLASRGTKTMRFGTAGNYIRLLGIKT